MPGRQPCFFLSFQGCESTVDGRQIVLAEVLTQLVERVVDASQQRLALVCGVHDFAARRHVAAVMAFAGHEVGRHERLLWLRAPIHVG